MNKDWVEFKRGNGDIYILQDNNNEMFIGDNGDSTNLIKVEIPKSEIMEAVKIHKILKDYRNIKFHEGRRTLNEENLDESNGGKRKFSKRKFSKRKFSKRKFSKRKSSKRKSSKRKLRRCRH
jgi:hypothetical protein